VSAAPDPLGLLWSVLQVGRLDLAEGSPPVYRRVLPRVRIDRKRILELMPDSGARNAIYAWPDKAVLLCLN